MVRKVLMYRQGLAAGLWATLIALALAAMPAAAQQAPTQAQINAFKSLPPEQQQELLKQLGVGSAVATTPAPAAVTAPTLQPKEGTVDATGQALPAAPLVEVEPRLRAGDTLILDVAETGAFPFTTAAAACAEREGLPLTPAQIEANRSFVEFQTSVRSGNPYRLDRAGRLVLANQITATLAGLTAEEAQERLNADPRLEGMTFSVKYLPVEPELKPFGYDLFTMVPTTFAPASDIPVPSNYVIGPGDTIELQLIGDSAGYYPLVVGRDGVVNLPELGPLAVAGLSYDAAKEKIEQQVSGQMIGTRANVSIGALRSIQVFVMGEAERPGSYTVSGLSTHDQCAVRERRRARDRVAAHDPADARRQARPPARPLRHAAARRHERRCAPAAGRRDLHPAGRRDGDGERRGAPARHL